MCGEEFRVCLRWRELPRHVLDTALADVQAQPARVIRPRAPRAVEAVPLIQPGQTAKLAVSFTKSGKYPYLCTVPGHAEAGMKGVFTVG